MEKNLEKRVKKLVKTTPLRLLGMKHACEYTQLSEDIENLVYVVAPSMDLYNKIEKRCVDGLYKQHITINKEPRMSAFYKEFNYEELMQKYEDKISELRKITEDIVQAHSKKELIYEEKLKVIDMLSRQFASSEFNNINLIEVVNLTKRDIEKLYKETKKVIESESEMIAPEEREEKKNEYIENLKNKLTEFWKNTTSGQFSKNFDDISEESTSQDDFEKYKDIASEAYVPIVKKKFKIWEWIKRIFKIKKGRNEQENI